MQSNDKSAVGNELVINNNKNGQINNVNSNKMALFKPFMNLSPLDIDEDAEVIDLENNPNIIDKEYLRNLAEKVFEHIDDRYSFNNFVDSTHIKHSKLDFDQVTNLSKTVQINNKAVRNIYRSPNNSIQHPVHIKNLKYN